MSRIFLLSANVATEPYPVYPLGMAVIARALMDRGHEVRQFDFLAEGRSDERLEAALRDFSPDVVGLSLRNIDNVDSFTAEKGWYLAQARAEVEIIRRTTRAPVILGGPAFSIMPEEILAYVGGDHGVVGEGEHLICGLVEAITAGQPMPALIRSEGPGLHSEAMASPCFQQDLVDFYVAQSGMVNLQTKRGCPFQCTYCTYPAIEGRTFRPRAPREVVDDLERMQRDHGVRSLFFTDSVFNDPQGHYLEVAEEMLRRDCRIRWCAFFRPKNLGRRELSLLKRSGLYALELGTDASSDTTLQGLGKSFTFDDVLAVNQACLGEGLPCAHFVIFGGPGETPETVREGLGNMERLGAAVVFAFSGIRIFPGAPLHAQAVAEGVIPEDHTLLRPVYYYSPAIEAQSMNEAIKQKFKGQRHRIFPPSEGQARLAVMQRFGFQGILWDKLVAFPKPQEATP